MGNTLKARPGVCGLLAAVALAAGFLTPLAAQSAKFTNPIGESPSVLRYSTGAFSLMAENGAVALYLNRESLAVRILNKRTGYVWSSDVDDFGKDYLNDRWKAFIKSGVTIEYYQEQRNAAGRATVDRSAVEESFLESGFSTARIAALPDGFRVDAVFGNSGIGISYETRISGDGIETTMDSRDVTESEQRIVSVQFYPFLGAVRQGEQAGYFVLPDGDGSLIRFDRVYNTITRNYQKRYFGDDRGISPVIENDAGFLRDSENLNFAVYGIVHGVHSDALMCEIKSAALFAELLVYPAGVRTNYYFISNRYLLRQPYTYIVSSGSQTTMITPARAEIRIRERFTVLGGADADYAGIARSYRAGLGREGLLKPRPPQNAPGNIPLYLNILAGAANEGMFRNNPFVMTGIAALSSIAEDMGAAGIGNLQVRYINGWRNELTGTERDRYTLWPGVGTLGELRALEARLQASGGRLILDFGPSGAYSRIGGLDLKEDVIRNINKRYDISNYRFGAVNFRSHGLNSGGISKLLIHDAGEIVKRGFKSENVFLASPASSFNEKTVWRDEAAGELAAALGAARKQLGYISTSRRNAIPEFFPHLDALVGLPMGAALFPYISDTVPFTSLVLRGSMDLFTENLNNAANPEEALLRMIEWGVYPAYRITAEDANKLIYSDMNQIESAKYDDYREEIIEVYTAVNAALKPVMGSAIAGHEALAEGLMKTSYENGAAVYVNYTSRPYIAEGVEVPPRGCKVRLP